MSEEEIEDLKNRLQNTEKALLALMAILQDFQPSCVQDGLFRLGEDYFNANVGLGFDPKVLEFVEKDG